MQSNKRRPVRRPRYRVIGGVPSIELKLRTPRQLFDERDPAPFRERDLDDDAVRYLVSSFKELKDQDDVKVQLYFESLGEFEQKPKDLARAIHQFFRYEADMRKCDLRGIFHQGLISLAIGLTFLVICTWFATSFDSAPKAFWESLLHEGLLVTGWCSMWKPISIFLHEWWPIADDMVTLRRLSTVEIQIELSKSSTVTVPYYPTVSAAITASGLPTVVPASVTTVTPGAHGLPTAAVPLATVQPELKPGSKHGPKKDYALA